MAYVNMTNVKAVALEEALDIDQLSEMDRIRLMTDTTFRTSAKELIEYLAKDDAYSKYAFYAPGFTSEVCRHLNLHEVSSFEYDSDTDVLVWIHTNANSGPTPS
eukprot:6488778-Amphidinium_carterae.1